MYLKDVKGLRGFKPVSKESETRMNWWMRGGKIF